MAAPTKPASSRTFKLTLASMIVAAFLLFVANSAIWVNRNIFNTDKFTQISTTSLLSDSSRQALANEIVDRALANQPTIRAAISEPATNLIAGLLNTNQAKTALTKLTSSLQILLTSKDPKSIEYDLTGIKNTATKLLTIANKDEAAVKVSNIPDQIVVFDASKIPPFYSYGLALTFIAPIAGLVALALLAWPYFKKSYPVQKLLLAQGGALIATGLLALLVGPIFRPPVLAQVSNANLRVVVENFYNAFIATFNTQTMYLIYAGAILVLVPLAQRLYKLLRSTYSTIQTKRAS